uniref:Queuosine 5'-phosphate N-glycosylase/hydrolase n=1 Tax=Candidatus Kentrum sp. SD TaxID=2126332 RepID=A0A451BRD3_9GAMM|nr:MAG: Potential Queuosine, Q, salvage protein family [Candidatus Kentron sp. SD]
MSNNKVLLTTRHVVDNSEHVSLNLNHLYRYCDDLIHPNFLHWIHIFPFDLFSLPFRERLHFITILDVTSFCYWPEPKWAVTYGGNTSDGTMALVASLAKGIEDGYPLTDFGYLSQMPMSDFDNVFNKKGTMPLKSDRLKILHETGRIVSNKFGGEFDHIVKLSKNDALVMLGLIVKFIPGFADTTIFEGKEVFFYKKAQLLISDIHYLFGAHDASYHFHNISKLTACADYKLPQVLRQHGILEYSEELELAIDCCRFLSANSKEEIEIRANTIWAVEEIKNNLRARGLMVESCQINDYLWLESQHNDRFDKPYHRVITTFY